MRRQRRAAGLASFLFCLTAALPALAEPEPVRIRYTEGAVTVQRARAGSVADAETNLPLEAGDRLWTSVEGRAELVTPAGDLIWLDGMTTLDVVALDEGGDRILRLWGGSLIVRTAAEDRGETLRIDTPTGSVRVQRTALLRVDLDATGRLDVAAFDGPVQVLAGGRTEWLAAGEATYAEPETAPAEPYAFNTAAADDFDRWQANRWTELAASVRQVRARPYVPARVALHAADLEGVGNWFYYADFDAWAWRPTVSLAVSWSPYRYGRWVYAYGAWTWVPASPWGWVTSHYGRWHHLPTYGWVWFPGYAYAPAWVSWYVGGGYVGWCPLGFYDRPFLSVNLFFGGHHGYGHGYHGPHHYATTPAGHGGRAIAGQGYTQGDGSWTFVRIGDLAARRPPRVAATEVARTARTARSLTLDGPLRLRDPARILAPTRPRSARPAALAAPAATRAPSTLRPVRGPAGDRPSDRPRATTLTPRAPVSPPRAVARPGGARPGAGGRTPAVRPRPAASPPVARPRPSARPESGPPMVQSRPGMRPGYPPAQVRPRAPAGGARAPSPSAAPLRPVPPRLSTRAPSPSPARSTNAPQVQVTRRPRTSAPPSVPRGSVQRGSSRPQLAPRTASPRAIAPRPAPARGRTSLGRRAAAKPGAPARRSGRPRRQ